MTLYSGLKIITPIPKIEKMVNQECCKFLNSKIPLCLDKIEQDISRGIKHILVTSPEYDSLVNDGELAKAFGIPQADAISKLDVIVNQLIGTIKVSFTKLTTSGNLIKGGIKVYALPYNMKEILSLQEGYVLTKKGQLLHWLDWLITHGDQIIITDYDIKYGPYPTSRAGGVIMTKSNGSVWRVPPQFAGTIQDNWIVRAVINNDKLIENVCAVSIKKRIEDVI